MMADVVTFEVLSRHEARALRMALEDAARVIEVAEALRIDTAALRRARFEAVDVLAVLEG